MNSRSTSNLGNETIRFQVICFRSELAAVAHSIVNVEGSDPMRCLQPRKEEDQIEINKRNQNYWCEPIIPGTHEAEAGASQVQSLST